MAVNPFRQLDVIKSASQKGNHIMDCYRLMYHKELWMKAYEKIDTSTNDLIKGKSNKVFNSFCFGEIDIVINQLKTNTFRFSRKKDACRAKFKKTRGASYNVDFKYIAAQKVIRMILENIYEPLFSENSHGFRKDRNCHTALTQIKRKWNNITWCIKVDINHFLFQMNHSTLLKILSKKIKDPRFLRLIHSAVSSGLVESQINNKGYNDTTQGSLLSPILNNIYLHELDLFLEKQMTALANELVNHQDMKYVRFAGHIVIGIANTKHDAIKIKESVHFFLERKLHFGLPSNVFQIIHLKHPVPFIGYQFHRKNNKKSQYATRKNRNKLFKKDPLSNMVKLEVPKKRIHEIAIKNGYGYVDKFKIMRRDQLLNYSEINILHRYNTELQCIASYYKLAHNFHHLKSLFFIAESSFIKTIAHKRKSSYKKVVSSMRVHKQGVLSLAYKDRHGNKKWYSFVKLRDMKLQYRINDKKRLMRDN